jgi:hypothetical protein
MEAMAIIFLKTEESYFVSEFMKEINKRLKVKDIIKNAFIGGVRCFKSNYYVIKMQPKYPKIYYIGLLYVLIGLVINKFSWTWWFIPGIMLSMSYIFFSSLFYKILLWRGLRKKGYTGKISFMFYTKFINEVV